MSIDIKNIIRKNPIVTEAIYVTSHNVKEFLGLYYSKYAETFNITDIEIGVDKDDCFVAKFNLYVAKYNSYTDDCHLVETTEMIKLNHWYVYDEWNNWQVYSNSEFFNIYTITEPSNTDANITDSDDCTTDNTNFNHMCTSCKYNSRKRIEYPCWFCIHSIGGSHDHCFYMEKGDNE